jgi:hypothetical protein
MNRGELTWLLPRDITMPTGSSNCAFNSCFIIDVEKDANEKPPERSGATVHHGSIGARICNTISDYITATYTSHLSPACEMRVVVKRIVLEKSVSD